MHGSDFVYDQSPWVKDVLANMITTHSKKWRLCVILLCGIFANPSPSYSVYANVWLNTGTVGNLQFANRESTHIKIGKIQPLLHPANDISIESIHHTYDTFIKQTCTGLQLSDWRISKPMSEKKKQNKVVTNIGSHRCKPTQTTKFNLYAWCCLLVRDA